MSPLAQAPTSVNRSLRLALYVGFFVAVIGLAGVVLFHRGTKFAAGQQIRSELTHLATAAAAYVDGDKLRKLHDDVTVDDPAYQELIAPLAKFHESFPQLFYLYTAKKDPQHNFRLVLDTANVLANAFPGRTLEPSKPGEIYDYPDPAMVKCFETGAPSSSPEPYEDNFGTFLTGCAPIRDSSGAMVGIIGVDLSIGDYNASLAWTWWAAAVGFVIAMFAGCLVGFITWVMARRWARAEALALNILESHSGYILRAQIDGTIIFANPALTNFVGGGVRPPCGGNLSSILSDDNEIIFQTLTRLRGDISGPSELEAALKGADGSTRIIRWRCREGHDDDHGAYVQCVGDDVTDLRNAEERLAISEQRHRLMVECASDIVTLMDTNGVFLYQSPALTRLLGYDENELVGKTVYDIIEPADERAIRWVLQFIADGRDISGRRWRLRYRHKNGTRVFLESSGQNRLNHPALRAIVVNSRDVTENERVLAELDRQNRLLVQSQSAARIGAIAYDKATGAIYWTKESFKILEVQPESFELSIESSMGFFNGTARRRLRMATLRCAARGTPFDLILPARTASGREIFVRTIGLPRMRGNEIAGIYGSMQDVTESCRQQEERSRFEEQMRQAQRLESLGVLAGGIAHDFNNLLTGILGNASLLALEFPLSGGPKALSQIEKSARRAADLCKQLVSYSGQRAVDSRPVDVDALIKETSELVSHSISKRAALSISAGAVGATVIADPTQIQQVVMNLVINASEALPGGVGEIILRTGIVDSAVISLADFHLVPADFKGRYLSLEVTDNGAGMTGEVLSRIFDPFFTTKFTGRGLGLAAVRGIVQAHKGALKVSSSPRHGTTFRLLFPIHDEKKARAAKNAGGGVSGGASSWNSAGSILISDDEETIRTLAKQLLRKHGFDVQVASDGEEALEMFYGNNGEYTAAVLDLTMPKMGGDAVLRAIRSTHPTLPVLMISGYTEMSEHLDRMRDRYTGFLGKPFSASEFAESLKTVMTRAPLA